MLGILWNLPRCPLSFKSQDLGEGSKLKITLILISLPLEEERRRYGLSRLSVTRVCMLEVWCEHQVIEDKLTVCVCVHMYVHLARQPIGLGSLCMHCLKFHMCACLVSSCSFSGYLVFCHEY